VRLPPSGADAERDVSASAQKPSQAAFTAAFGLIRTPRTANGEHRDGAARLLIGDDREALLRPWHRCTGRTCGPRCRTIGFSTRYHRRAEGGTAEECVGRVVTLFQRL
jgi:hypothetical protein